MSGGTASATPAHAVELEASTATHVTTAPARYPASRRRVLRSEPCLLAFIDSTPLERPQPVSSLPRRVQPRALCHERQAYKRKRPEAGSHPGAAFRRLLARTEVRASRDVLQIA